MAGAGRPQRGRWTRGCWAASSATRALIHLGRVAQPHANFTIVGIKPANYDNGMKLTRHHIAWGRKISWAESKKQPYTPWAPDPYREYPARKTHRGGRGQKHRRKHDPEDDIDLTGASDSDGEPGAKQQRRYSPTRRPDRSPPHPLGQQALPPSR